MFFPFRIVQAGTHTQSNNNWGSEAFNTKPNPSKFSQTTWNFHGTHLPESYLSFYYKDVQLIDHMSR